ncbi:VirB4 family type IV secretion system protein [Halorubrum sp. AJ67]|uniref:VirB4 family type IV secretion system protein n=1 Tax=Halorubrum sp. AJ67 TaxID=1173487 RepID=UPI0003DC545D|nr:transfer complex protein [Halorubrum sp. AJ67]CDK39187.1 transfer complex protein [Halorubrum sp. AJ67]
MIRNLLPFTGSNNSEANGDDEATTDETPDDQDTVGGESQLTVTYESDGEAVDGIPEIHQTVVSPSSIERTPSALRTDDQWAQSLWVGEYPDAPMDGFLEKLYAAAETQQTDISIHIDPRDTRETLDSLENKIEDLEADYEYLTEKHRASARGVEKDLEDHQEMYDVLRNTTMQAFDISTYLTVRGDERDNVNTESVSTTARQAPANLTPVTPRWSQLKTFTSASPIALDQFNETLDSKTPMLGGAVGAMFPFVSGAFAEPGIEYGTYALNSSPLILDRFNRQTGYCMMVVGRLGAGKSFATKLRLVRRAMFDEDTVIIMLDPMRGFAGVNEALDGERVTVGGRRGLNPLEIKPTPDHVLQEVDDIDPWGEQITWVMTFFATFFEHVADHPLGERNQTLRRAVQEAYEKRGIIRDPETHTRDSPTIHNVIEVLEEMVEDPEEYGYVTDGEQEAVQSDAQSLLKDLRPSFREGGELENLAQPSEFNLDSKVIYLDLHQEEGTRGRAETSLMMQVLFNSVYERVKQTDKRVVFCIDEAHYLMNDAVSLDFLETAVRHSRHFDLSLEFITQTGGEFALTPEARTIANLCSLTVLHRVNEEKEKITKWFDLSERQVNWVTSAKAGEDEDGYSEALVGIDQEGWFPLRIRASDYEAHVIDGGAADVVDIEPGSGASVTNPDSPAAGARADGRGQTSTTQQEDE